MSLNGSPCTFPPRRPLHLSVGFYLPGTRPLPLGVGT
jgi:hypothetical protein